VVAEKITEVGGSLVANKEPTVTNGFVIDIDAVQRFAETWVGNGGFPGPV
jgi:hypothetical protein